MTTKATLEKLKTIDNEQAMLGILTNMKKGELRRLLELNKEQRESWETELEEIKTQLTVIEKEYISPKEEEVLLDILQKEIEDTLTLEEREKFVEEFEGDSPSEIKHKIQTGDISERSKPLVKRIIKSKIFKWLSLGLAVSILGIYIYNYQMKPYYDQKALDEYNKEMEEKYRLDGIAHREAREQAIADSTALAKQKEEEAIKAAKLAEEERKRKEWDQTNLTIQEAQASIPKGLLKGVSYKELVNTVQGIRDTSVRKRLIGYIMEGDVVSAQGMYAMKKYSTSPYNTANGKLDKRTLNRFSDHLFGLSKDRLLQSPSMPADLKEVYKNFVNNSYNNHGKNYLILSKDNLQLYLFSPDHKLIYHQPILSGTESGDATFVPYSYYKNANGKLFYHGKKVHTTTPSGMYKTNFIMDQSIYYTPFFQLTPINSHTQKVDNRFEYDRFILGIHESGTTKRHKALASSTTSDNRMTHGCVVASNEGLSVLKDNNPYIVYICKE